MSQIKVQAVTPGVEEAILNLGRLSQAEMKVVANTLGIGKAGARALTPFEKLTKTARNLGVAFLGANAAAGGMQRVVELIKSDIQETLRLQDAAAERQRTFAEALGSFALSNSGIVLEGGLPQFREAALTHGAVAGAHGPARMMRGFELALPQLPQSMTEQDLLEAAPTIGKAMALNPELNPGEFIVTAARFADAFGTSLSRGIDLFLATVAEAGAEMGKLAKFMPRVFTTTSRNMNASRVVSPELAGGTMAFATSRLGDISTERVSTAAVEFFSTFNNRDRVTVKDENRKVLFDQALRGADAGEKLINFARDIGQLPVPAQQALIAEARKGGGGTGALEIINSIISDVEAYVAMIERIREYGRRARANEGQLYIDEMIAQITQAAPEARAELSRKQSEGKLSAENIESDFMGQAVKIYNSRAAQLGFGLEVEDLTKNFRQSLNRLEGGIGPQDFLDRETAKLLRIAANRITKPEDVPVRYSFLGSSPTSFSEQDIIANRERKARNQLRAEARDSLAPFIDLADIEGFYQQAARLGLVRAEDGISPIERTILNATRGTPQAMTPAESTRITELSSGRRTKESQAELENLIRTILDRFQQTPAPVPTAPNDLAPAPVNASPAPTPLPDITATDVTLDAPGVTMAEPDVVLPDPVQAQAPSVAISAPDVQLPDPVQAQAPSDAISAPDIDAPSIAIQSPEVFLPEPVRVNAPPVELAPAKTFSFAAPSEPIQGQAPQVDVDAPTVTATEPLQVDAPSVSVSAAGAAPTAPDYTALLERQIAASEAQTEAIIAALNRMPVEIGESIPVPELPPTPHTLDLT